MKPKRPRDPFQLAKAIGDIATGQAEDAPLTRRAAAGSKGGLIGGKARMDAMTPEQRKRLAEEAAAARWNKTAPVVQTGAGTAKSKSVKQR